LTCRDIKDYELPELVLILKKFFMKTLNFELTRDLFIDFELSNEEMIYVHGGTDPESIPTPPPIKI
jgi:hypothetical protein